LADWWPANRSCKYSSVLGVDERVFRVSMYIRATEAGHTSEEVENAQKDEDIVDRKKRSVTIQKKMIMIIIIRIKISDGRMLLSSPFELLSHNV